jgi:hypothetical protein
MLLGYSGGAGCAEKEDVNAMPQTKKRIVVIGAGLAGLAQQGSCNNTGMRSLWLKPVSVSVGVSGRVINGAICRLIWGRLGYTGLRATH